MLVGFCGFLVGLFVGFLVGLFVGLLVGIGVGLVVSSGGRQTVVALYVISDEPQPVKISASVTLAMDTFTPSASEATL